MDVVGSKYQFPWVDISVVGLFPAFTDVNIAVGAGHQSGAPIGSAHFLE